MGGSVAEPEAGLHDIGACLLHRKFKYRGVIVDHDAECTQTEAWIRANGVDALKRGDLIACGHIDVKKRGDYAAVCEGGVRMNHAFAVVGATPKEAKVYNPMGVDDGYTNGKTDGNGTLTMTWSEFIKSFTRMQLCRRSSRGGAWRLPERTHVEWAPRAR
mgnify:CR=1 FL=1